MTVEVDVHGRIEVSESEVAKGEVNEEHSGLDTSSYHDLTNGSSHCNGISHSDDGTKNEVNWISKGDVDVSYVFVNVNDAKDGDVVDAELVGNSIGDMSVGSGVSELKMENGKTQLDGEVGDAGVVKVQNGDVGISKLEKESFNSGSKATEEVDETGGSQVTHIEFAASDCKLKTFENGKLEVEAEGEESHGARFTLKGSDEFNSYSACDGGEKSDRESNLESVQSQLEHEESEIAIEENVQNVALSDKEQKVSSNEVYVEGSSKVEVCGDNLQQNSSTVLSSDVEILLEAANHNDHVIGENANGFPASHEQGSSSENLDICQKPAESPGSSKNIDIFLSPVMLGDASSANGQVPTSHPGDDKSPNEGLVKGSIAAVGMNFEQSLGALGSEVNAMLETDVSVSIYPLSCVSETEDSLPSGLGQDSIPGTVQEQNVRSENFENMTSSSCCDIVTAEIDQDVATPIINNTIVKTYVGDAVSLFENLSTCNVEDVRVEAETGKSVEKCGEKPEACPTDFSEVAIQADNGAVANDTIQSCLVHEKSESKVCLASLEDVKDEVTSDAMNGESRILNSISEYGGSNDAYGAHADAEIQIFPPVDNQDSLPAFVDDAVKPDPEVDHTSAVSRDIPNDDNIAPESSLPNSTILETGSAVDENLKAKSDEASESSSEGVVHIENNVDNIKHISAVRRDRPEDDSIAPESYIPNSSSLNTGSAVDENLKAKGDEASQCSPKGIIHNESNVENIAHMSAVSRDIPSDDNIAPESNIPNSTSLISGSEVDENLKAESDKASESSPEVIVHIKDNVDNIEHMSAVSQDIPDDDNVAPESNIPNSIDLYIGSAVDKNLKAESDESSKSSPEGFVHIESGVELTFHKAKAVGIHKDETSKSFPNNVVEGDNMGPDVVKRPLCFLVRMPRYDDENIRERIKQAQLQVEEKTKIRDVILTKIQKKRETCKEYDDIFQAAASKERAARDLLKSKRQEMDSVQFMINKVKSAMSIEDLDGQIRSMEHMIEHETMPLKKEKELIRDINKLKLTREHISSNMVGKEDEVQQALDQKDQIEERLKILRRDMDLLRDNLFRAEKVTQAAKKKLNVEKDGVNELLSKCRAADSIRQDAYTHMHSLKKQLYEQNKYFWKYREDAKTAYNLALIGHREQLHRFCSEQVEIIMELWNKNDDFRREYLRCNSRSTLRRLRTSDGRSLGPEEELPVIPNSAHESVSKNSSAAQVSTPTQENLIVPPEAKKQVDIPVDKIVKKKNQTDKAKTPAKVSSLRNDSATVSSRDVIIEETEEHKRTKEEEELARKAEEKTKEAAAARLKEQRRLEEKTKAKEALERKKRIAEKAQARAAIKAQKEAEEKEKEREKRLKKKEKKKANANARNATTDGGEGKSVPTPSFEISSGTPEEFESIDKPTTVTRKPRKKSQLMKQSKPKSIPPLRNKGKRRIQAWMWVFLTFVVVFALLFVGNTSFSFKSSLQYLGF